MDVSTLAVALGYTKKQVEQAKREGFRVQIEQDRSILETTGEEKIFYFLPKTSDNPTDGYDEFVYTNNNWEQVGVTDVDLNSYATKNEVGNLNNLPTTDKSSIVSAISETFTSVSNGKSLVASAITDKGVSTSSDATFEIMAQNIEAIPTGSDFDMTVADNQIKMVVEVDSFDLSFWTRFGCSGNAPITVTVDWGDGTTDTYAESTVLEYAIQRKHNYQEAGRYLVTETAENGTLTIGSVNGYSTLSEGEIDGYYNKNDTLRYMYNYKIKELAYGDSIDIYNGFRGIPYIKIHNNVDYHFMNTSTDSITIKDGRTSIAEYQFNNVTAYIVKIPNSVTTISNYAFAGSKIRILDFTDISLNDNGELPITFTSTNIFNGTSNSMVLLFATQEIAEVAKTTTNLSQLASQIKYVGEV